MSAEKPEPGDVLVTENKVFVTRPHSILGVIREQIALMEEGPDGLLFNLLDLLAGDPSAWAAALRFAPEVFLLAVGEGEERRDVLALPKSHELVYLAMDDWRTGESLTAKVLGGRWWVEGSANGMTGIEECAGDFPTAVRAALKGEGDGD